MLSMLIQHLRVLRAYYDGFITMFTAHNSVFSFQMGAQSTDTLSVNERKKITLLTFPTIISCATRCAMPQVNKGIRT